MAKIRIHSGSNSDEHADSRVSSNQSGSGSSEDSDSSSSSSSDSESSIEKTAVPKKNKSSREYPLEGQIRQPKNRTFRTADVTESTLTDKYLNSLLNYPESKKAKAYFTEPGDRIHIPVEGCVGFYSQALSVGVGLPIHPFFVSILKSYGIAPAQLTPFAWSHMLGMHFLWTDLGLGEPTLDIWHYLYKIHRVNDHSGFYFFTKWGKGGETLITNYPSGSGDWRTRFFYLDIATGGPGLPDEFAEARTINRPSLSESELKQVEIALSQEDRSWKGVSRGRGLCAMGKFKVKDNSEKLKEKARSMKEKTPVSNPKRKEADLTVPPKSTQPKKSKTQHVSTMVESSQPSSAVVEFGVGKGKGVMEEREDVDKSNPSPVRLTRFFGEVTKAFTRSSIDTSSTNDPDSEQKLRLSFNNSARALYAQFDVLEDFSSLQKPLKEKLAKLIRQLSETESDLEACTRAFKKKEVAFDKLASAKKEADEAVESSNAVLESVKKEHEAEAAKFHEEIARMAEENAMLKKGVGVDIEALVESADFAPMKDFIEDSFGEDLIQQIKDVHPDLDLSFLSMGGVEDPGTIDQGKIAEHEKNPNDAAVSRIPTNSAKDSVADGEAS